LTGIYPGCYGFRLVSTPYHLGRIALIALALASVTGCAGSGSVKRLEQDTRSRDARLAEMGQATEDLKKELGRLREQIEAVRRELAEARQADEAREREAVDTVGKRVAAAEKRLDTLSGAVRGVEMSVGGLSDQVARLEAVSASNAAVARRDGRTKPPARAAAAPLGADELFARGMDSFKAGELAQAILDFEDFVTRNGSHPLAPAAQFFIGEAYYSARDYQHATVEYQKVVDMAPRGERVPEALLKLGLSYRALKRNDRAREAWAQLMQEFPQSEPAGKARAALRETPRAGK
jgi:tol-pal system protein YbgF